MKTKLVQILYDMRHQPVIGWVTIIGTAMAIFLIMVVTMIQEVAVTPFAPESCRDRLLVGVYMHVAGENGHDGSSGLNQKTARRIYAGLEGIEHAIPVRTGRCQRSYKRCLHSTDAACRC